MNKNTNKAIYVPVLTIRVVEIVGNTVYYWNYHSPKGKPFKFVGTIGCDRKTISQLEPGRGYAICQKVDETNTTHWTCAMTYSGGHTPKYDAIMMTVSAKRAEVKVRDFLEDTIEW